MPTPRLLQMPANTTPTHRENDAKRGWHVGPLTRAYAYTQAHARDNFACNAVNRCNTHIYSTFPVYSRYRLLTGTPKTEILPPSLFTAVYKV